MTLPRQVLPELSAYRTALAAETGRLPLAVVSHRPDGLMRELPESDNRQGWPWTIQTETWDSDGQTVPRITVVMPSFQQGQYLEESLRSVLLQNYPNLELIVMDGGSTDSSREIIEKYRRWLSFARIARDRGQAHAINLGFSLASGEIRGWLNSDDLYLPGALWRVADAYRKGSDFIYGNALVLQQATGRRRHEVALFAHSRYTRNPGLVPSHATFWSASRHQPLWEELECAMDYELWIRLLPGARARHIPYPLGVARLHNASKSGDAKMAARWANDARLNGEAHPELYKPQRWREREYALVQRTVWRWRKRGERAVLRRVSSECGWPDDIEGAQL